MRTEIEHDNVIQRDDIGEYLDYIDGLKRDSEDEDYSDEERASFREELDENDPELIEQLRTMYEETSNTEESFISEYYWDDYAAEYADDILLSDAPDTLRSYFDYDAWSRDLCMDYTAYTYDGTTYYTRT